MNGMMQKRIAFLFVAALLLVALVPAVSSCDDESPLKDTSAHRVYNQLYAAHNITYDFDCIIGWTRNSSTLDAVWHFPNVVHSSIVSRAPPA